MACAQEKNETGAEGRTQKGARRAPLPRIMVKSDADTDAVADVAVKCAGLF